MVYMLCIFVVWDFYCFRNFKNLYFRNFIMIVKLELMGIIEIVERVCDCIMLGDYEDGSLRV